MPQRTVDFRQSAASAMLRDAFYARFAMICARQRAYGMSSMADFDISFVRFRSARMPAPLRLFVLKPARRVHTARAAIGQGFFTDIRD